MDGLNQMLIGLTHAVRDLAHEIHHHNDNQKILCRIEHAERTIMSAISEFSAKQNQFNTRQAASIDSAVVSVNGLTEDVAELNRKITELQESPGEITIEDQELLDELTAQGEAVAAKGEALATALKTLDGQNPPTPPVA